MSDLNTTQLRRLDLTLLLVLSEGLRTRKLGQVAENLGLTPSAISHALSRLRDIFDDPLFVRRPKGIEPTPRALELAEPVGRAIELLTGTLQRGTFDPARINRTFRVAALDYLITMHAPHLIETIRTAAPDARLAFVSLGRQEALRRLLEGQLDLDIGVYPDAPDRYHRHLLGRSHFVTVARKKHPAFTAGMTLDRYVAADHIVVSGSGELTTGIDSALERLGRARRVIAALPQFLASLQTVANSDAIASVPSGVAERYAKAFGLEIFPFPLDLPPFEFVALTALHANSDPALQWLIGQLKV